VVVTKVVQISLLIENSWSKVTIRSNFTHKNSRSKVTI